MNVVDFNVYGFIDNDGVNHIDSKGLYKHGVFGAFGQSMGQKRRTQNARNAKTRQANNALNSGSTTQHQNSSLGQMQSDIRNNTNKSSWDRAVDKALRHTNRQNPAPPDVGQLIINGKSMASGETTKAQNIMKNSGFVEWVADFMTAAFTKGTANNAITMGRNKCDRLRQGESCGCCVVEIQWRHDMIVTGKKWKHYLGSRAYYSGKSCKDVLAANKRNGQYRPDFSRGSLLGGYGTFWETKTISY